jgi:hypothetical protein
MLLFFMKDKSFQVPLKECFSNIVTFWSYSFVLYFFVKTRMVWSSMIMVCLYVRKSFYKWHQVGFVVGTICWRWLCLKMMIGNNDQFVWLLTCSQIDFKVLEFLFVVVVSCFLRIQISQTWSLGYYALTGMINWNY